jgi:hypothetical protein
MKGLMSPLAWPAASPLPRPEHMPTQLTPTDVRQSLNAHVAMKGREVWRKYGPRIGWGELGELLKDRAHVRYPCEIVFDAGALEPGELAYPEPRGERPEDGFTIYVRPVFLGRLAEVPALVLYQLVVVNYGEFASPADAETFGAAALGMEVEEYYQLLCEIADEVA